MGELLIALGIPWLASLLFRLKKQWAKFWDGSWPS
jgi:hypothetical protein